MPATVTHSFFAKDVFDILPEDIQNNIDVNRSKMFGQSLDSLMFYNLFSFMPGKRIRNFRSYFHTNRSQDYFINLLNYIKDNNINDKDTYSFLLGMICHYALDSTIHPYVFYKTGLYSRSEPCTFKYNNVHAFMETFIDNDMISRRLKTNPYKFNFKDFCFDIYPFSDDLNKTIYYSFYNTFNISDMNNVYYKSLKQMRTAINIFRRDPYGIKKFFYKLVDTFSFKGTYRFEAISYHYPLEDKHNYLNSNHSTWRHPVIYDQTSTESFVDLYLKAIKSAKVLMCASWDYLNGKDIELEKIFTNLSYTTGLDCNDGREMKYFEY